MNWNLNYIQEIQLLNTSKLYDEGKSLHVFDRDGSCATKMGFLGENDLLTSSENAVGLHLGVGWLIYFLAQLLVIWEFSSAVDNNAPPHSVWILPATKANYKSCKEANHYFPQLKFKTTNYKAIYSKC